MDRPAQRIVSLIPSWTHSVWALGAVDRLVGCTRYCVEPDVALRRAVRVGGTKNPDLEAILELQPDLVLTNAEENRPEHIDALRQRVPVFEATPKSVADAIGVVRDLGRLLGAEQEAQALALEAEAQMARGEVERLRGGTVRVFYAIWCKPWMAVNRDTYIHDVLTRAGAWNVAMDAEDRYPSYEVGELVRLGAELVLLPDEPFVFEQRHRQEVLEQQLFGAGIPVELVSGKDFCWHGAWTGPGLGRAIDVIGRLRDGAGR